MNENKDIKKEILNKIKEGEVSMKPKIHFVLQSFAIAFGIIIGTLISLFLFSFIIFTLKGSGAIHLSAFGGKGLILLMLSIPWLLVIAVLLLVLILEILSKHFAFVYRKPAIYSTLGILLLIVFAGSVLASTPLHKNMYERAYLSNVPFGGGELYKRFGAPPIEGGYAGKIESIDFKGITIVNPNGELIIIATTTETKYAKDKELEVGEHVLAIGDERDGILIAEWVKPLRGKNAPLEYREKRFPNPPLRPIFDNLK